MRLKTTAGLALVFCSTLSIQAETIFGLTGGNSLVIINSLAPGLVGGPVAITGLGAGETLVGIDFRPANGLLYGVGSLSQIYTINTTTGMATAVGPMLNVPLSGSFFGVDFNPAADRIRVISNTGQNLRINPNDGVVATNVGPGGDGPLAFIDGTPGSPNAIAAAYTNNVKGAATTTLYNLDATRDTMLLQAPPNAGSLTTIGGFGFDIPSIAGFDISGATGAGFVSFNNNLYSINLATGAGTLVGAIGGAGGDIFDISVQPIPEPSTIAMMLAGLGGLMAWRRRRRA